MLTSGSLKRGVAICVCPAEPSYSTAATRDDATSAWIEALLN
jgi:hypothetical protein